MMEREQLKALIENCSRILAAFDACGAGDEAEELNAQFEDVIFLIESIDPDEDDVQEELEGAFEEMDDLIEEYAALGEDVREPLESLRALVALARTQV